MPDGGDCRAVCERIEGLIAVNGNYKGRNNASARAATLVANRVIRLCPRCDKWMYVGKLVGSKNGRGFQYYCPCCKSKTKSKPKSRKSKEILVMNFGMEKKYAA